MSASRHTAGGREMFNVWGGGKSYSQDRKGGKMITRRNPHCVLPEVEHS